MPGSGNRPPDILEAIQSLAGRTEVLEKTTGDGIELDDGTTISYDLADALVNGTIRVYVQADAPTGLNASTDVGSFWYDTDDDNARYVWDGFSWVPYTSSVPFFVGSSSLAALGLGILARSLTGYRIYSQGTTPSTPAYGWLWRDTAHSNAIKFYNGSTWVTVTDTNIIAAVNAALAPPTDLSDSFLKVYYQTAAPGGQTAVTDIGNRWYDTDDGYKCRTWNGSGWALTEDDIVSTDTDGAPPSYSPTPEVLAGIGSLFVSWDPVPNNDQVVYAVYVGTASPVVPSSTTYAGEVQGTFMLLRQLPNGAAFANGTTYYAAIIARDPDGLAPQSPSVSGSVIAKITSTEISDSAISTPKLAANAITTSLLLANDAWVGALRATDFTSETITGATIRTSSSATTNGVVLSSSGLKGYKSGVQVFSVSNTGDVDILGAFRTASGTGQRMVMRNDGSGGILEGFSGISGEVLPGVFNPSTVSGFPGVTIQPGTTSSYTERPFMSMYTSTVGGSSVNIQGANVALRRPGSYTLLLGPNGTTIGGPLNVANYSIISDGLADGGTDNQASGTKYARVTALGQICSSTTAPSSRRLKQNIKYLDMDPEKILKLRARSYQYKESPQELRTGFIAEEAHDLGLGRFLGYDDHSDPDRPTGFAYDDFVAAHQIVLQSHQKLIADMQKELTALREELSTLKKG